MFSRADLIVGLRRIAESPDGVAHRQTLFRAALMLDRDANTIFTCQSCSRAKAHSEREGDPAQP
jgi:hypothetical protein